MGLGNRINDYVYHYQHCRIGLVIPDAGSS